MTLLSPSPCSILTVDNLTPCFFKTHFNIISSTTRSPKQTLPFTLPKLNVYFCEISLRYACYKSRTFHLDWFAQPNNILRRLQIMKFGIIKGRKKDKMGERNKQQELWYFSDKNLCAFSSLRMRVTCPARLNLLHLRIKPCESTDHEAPDQTNLSLRPNIISVPRN
jgi:hypothetical protein